MSLKLETNFYESYLATIGPWYSHCLVSECYGAIIEQGVMKRG
jgi:hypothetical protein